jgi:hypothetical protein
MDKLQNAVSIDVIKKCLTGVPFDLGTLDTAQLKDCAVIMVHCCVNGPVGVNNPTTFPMGLKGSIKELVSQGLTNGTWRATCIPFAKYLKAQYPDVIQDCQQVRLHSDLWPLWDLDSR